MAVVNVILALFLLPCFVIIHFLSQISTTHEKQNNKPAVFYIKAVLRIMFVIGTVKKSTLMFLALILFHCGNARYFLVKTENEEGNEINAGAFTDQDDSYDDSLKEDEAKGGELPDDLQLLNDSLEAGTKEAKDKRGNDYLSGTDDDWIEQLDCRNLRFMTKKLYNGFDDKYQASHV